MCMEERAREREIVRLCVWKRDKVLYTEVKRERQKERWRERENER